MKRDEELKIIKNQSVTLASIDGHIKNKALTEIKKALREKKDEIVKANNIDIVNAKNEHLSAPLLKRLVCNENTIDSLCRGIDVLSGMEDPVGRTLCATELDKGLDLYKVSSPIGVIGIVFESRPDALVQISTLCLKSGNAVILKGGREAINTNRILADIVRDSAVRAGFPASWLTLLETREDVNEILKLHQYIDLLIPRGSREFITYIIEHTSIPVLGHADGICHVYVDEDADPEMACSVTVDAKCQYVAVCNAAETLLVHAGCAETLLPKIHGSLKERGVVMRGCEKTVSIIPVPPAGEDDWKTEYLDLELSIKVTENIDEAIDHINTYGSHHTDTIVTSNKKSASEFLKRVDSACVFVNCSTRFSDGYRFGLGAEVGISTGKIHARGPVGIEGLLIYRWLLVGGGHIVADYAGDGGRRFTHIPLKKRLDIDNIHLDSSR
ncbi:MAG: glutamate-5-semialdehyde dehydrogenase [Spirochaetales bacterium]|nr:glutamate-5-semialdehyde dehydrogenase [Spirochaetales bacterium]